MYSVVFAALLAGNAGTPAFGNDLGRYYGPQKRPVRGMPAICHGCYGWGWVYEGKKGIVNSPGPSYGPSYSEHIQQSPVYVNQPVIVGQPIYQPQPAYPVSAAAPISSKHGAHITVRLPADARLFIDNVACPLTSRVRSFDTPELSPGRRYYYSVRAEMLQDGRTVTKNRRIIVSAGQQVNVDFTEIAITGNK